MDNKTTSTDQIVKEFEEKYCETNDQHNGCEFSLDLRTALEKVRNEAQECQTCHSEGSTCTHPTTVREKEAYEQGKNEGYRLATRKESIAIEIARAQAIQATRAEDVAAVEKIAKEFSVTYEQAPFYHPKLNKEETKFGKDVIRFVLAALKSLNRQTK